MESRAGRRQRFKNRLIPWAGPTPKEKRTGGVVFGNVQTAPPVFYQRKTGEPIRALREEGVDSYGEGSKLQGLQVLL